MLSAINDCNDYTGPGTGYRLEGETWDALQRIPQQKSPRAFIDAQVGDPLPNLAEVGTAKVGNSPNEIVVAVGPAYGRSLVKTIGELDHEAVLEALLTGVAEKSSTVAWCGSITVPKRCAPRRRSPATPATRNWRRT